MINKEYSDSISKYLRKMEQKMTVRRFAEGVGSAAIIGIVAGIVIAHKPKKKTIEYPDKQPLHSTITIEVQDLQKLIIEGIE